jgi:hypothetical protein
LLGAAATAVAFGITALVEDGVIAAVVRGATWLILGAALWAFLWTFTSLQLGLYRLGAEPIGEEARMDPGLGLGPLGDVAFTALWILLAWLVPLVLTGLSDVVGFGVGVLTAVLATFFLSLVRLHHRMVEAKSEELAFARELYAQAHAPVRERPSLETFGAAAQLARGRRRARDAGEGDPRLADRRRDVRARDHDRDQRRGDHDRTPDPRPVRALSCAGRRAALSGVRARPRGRGRAGSASG